ncbi:MAG: 4Fe-4S dicluster domain-containing protein [Oscillospiraceae bacterium]|nr:4Fe-4S dicluster domain-containing protein [Oscillospiraceae bacterium]
MKKVYAVQNLCLNCKLCEVYCKTAHSQTKNIVKAYKEEVPEPSARIVVEGDNQASLALQCRHCESPACVEACITGAMQKNPKTGLVSTDETRCVACMTCLAACPYGIIRVNERAAMKCDLCQGEEAPACVQNCPNRALVCVDIYEEAER